MNKISVLMPVYNGMPLIKASIESLYRQTYENWECIIVDDGSQDGTTQFVDSIKDKRVVVYHFEKNQGRPIARQKSLDLATGDYIAILDAEDLYSPNKLQSQLQLLLNNPDVDLVSSGMCSFGVNSNLIRNRGGEDKAKIIYDGSKLPNHATCLLRASIAKNIPYNQMMKYGQDQDFLERYLKGRMFIDIPDITYYYSEFDSVTKKKIRKTYKLCAKKYFHQKKFRLVNIYILKYIYSIIAFPFISIENIIKKRGRELTDIEKSKFLDECLTVINSVVD